MGHATWSGLTDIHCHLLPGIDDGAKSWNESLQMAAQAVSEGIATSILTPHQLGNYTHNSGDSIRRLTADFQQKLDDHGIPLRVLPGADVRIDTDMIDRLCSGDCLTLGDTGRYVLLELPHELYIPLEPILDQLHSIGVTGILSHPERNQGILRQPKLIPGLIQCGCLMQITADSLTGTFGPAPEACCRSMLEAGQVHFLATDAHSPRSRRPRIQAALDIASEICGPAFAEAIGSVNPAAVALGEECPQLPSRSKRHFFSRWFASRAS